VSDTLTFDEAVAALTTASRFGIHPSLDGIRALTDTLERPQDSLRCIQVTGTNGKSSVTRMIADILCAHGIRAAAYTSPHLESYTERVELCGESISPEAFSSAMSSVLDAAKCVRTGEGFTEFELVTATALEAMRFADMEWAVLEVGMGGRWDATSVVAPEIAVVTGVALDHTDRLGSDRHLIAQDKAHIITKGSVAVLGPGIEGVEDIFAERAKVVGAATIRVSDERVRAEVGFRIAGRPSHPGGRSTFVLSGGRLTGIEFELAAPSYQVQNAAVAITAAEVALEGAIDPGLTREALAALRYPGRFETVSAKPVVVIDGAHNPQAAQALAGAITEAFGQRKPVLVLGVLADKDVEGIASPLIAQASAVVCTQNSSDRCLSAADLAVLVGKHADILVEAESSLAKALQRAMELGADDGVVVSGSLYTAGEARSIF